MTTWPGRFTTNWDEPLKTYIDEADDRTRPGATWDTIGSGPMSHHTGGGPYPYLVTPSRSAIEACINQGCVAIEADIYPDTNGKLWSIHAKDSPSSLTSVTDLPPTLLFANAGSTEFANARLSPAKIMGSAGSYPYEPIMSFEELLDQVANRVPLVLEMKAFSTGPMKKVLDVAAPAILSRGLRDRVVVDCADERVNWAAPLYAQYGLRWHMYAGADYANDDDFLALCQSIEGYSGCNMSPYVDDAHLTQWLSMGFVIGDFYERKSSAMASGDKAGQPVTAEWWTNRGVKLWTGDNGPYIAGTVPTRTVDPWRFGFWGTGDIPNAGAARPTLTTTGLEFTGIDPKTPFKDPQWMLAGDFAPLPDAFTMDCSWTAGATLPTAVGLFICAPTDASFTNASYPAGTSGYFCYLGMSGGRVRIYDHRESTDGTKADVSTTPITAGQTFYTRIVVNSTTVEFSVRDAAGALVGNTASYTDASARGGYLHVGAVLGAAGATAKLNSLTITPA